ncbi:MAG: aldo/keto reductase [Verrucomicrobia bacterium]|nr:aldo/keto reductase [Verrucomicrobiota bacterium]MBU1908616.1 aldo/keto reductase [Verrucomicrobiota bacterium]
MNVVHNLDLTWREESVSRMVLGTAQLGLNYGIANTDDKPAADESREIIKAAWGGGACFFDTAQGYGDSEKVLGQFLKEAGVVDQAGVITKLDPGLNPENPNEIYDSIVRSADRLGKRPLWAVLLHRAEWLRFLAGGLGEALKKARRDNLVRFLGVSVYTVEEARQVLTFEEMDVLQIPCNAWDQRMLASGLLAEARKKDRLCFVRSIYLQGLLLMTAAQVAARLPDAAKAAECWWAVAEKLHIPPAELAMRFALSLDCPLVIGAERAEQVRTNVNLMKLSPLSKSERATLEKEMQPLISADILNPARWQQA